MKLVLLLSCCLKFCTGRNIGRNQCYKYSCDRITVPWPNHVEIPKLKGGSSLLDQAGQKIVKDAYQIYLGVTT